MRKPRPKPTKAKPRGKALPPRGFITWQHGETGRLVTMPIGKSPGAGWFIAIARPVAPRRSSR